MPVARRWRAPRRVDRTVANHLLLRRRRLRGLAGQMEEPVSRWIGGWGHELGHAFGLPHPPDGDPNWNDAIMGFGYLTFPNAILLPSDKGTLLNSGHFTR